MDYVGVRKNREATALGAGQQGREGNKWIKSGSRLDLKSMRADSTRQLAGARGARAGQRKRPTDAPLTFDIGAEMKIEPRGGIVR